MESAAFYPTRHLGISDGDESFSYFSLTGKKKFCAKNSPRKSLITRKTSHVDFSRSTHTKTTPPPPPPPLWGLYRQREICQKREEKEKLCQRCDIPRIFSFTPVKYPKSSKSRNDFLRGKNHNDVISLSLSLSSGRAPLWRSVSSNREKNMFRKKSKECFFFFFFFFNLKEEMDFYLIKFILFFFSVMFFVFLK